MRDHVIQASRPAELRSRICEVERRISHRQGEIGAALDDTLAGVTVRLKARLTSPGTILAAGLLGAALQRDHQFGGLKRLAILQAVDAGLRLMLAAPSRD